MAFEQACLSNPFICEEKIHYNADAVCFTSNALFFKKGKYTRNVNENYQNIVRSILTPASPRNDNTSVSSSRPYPAQKSYHQQSSREKNDAKIEPSAYGHKIKCRGEVADSQTELLIV